MLSIFNPSLSHTHTHDHLLPPNFLAEIKVSHSFNVFSSVFVCLKQLDFHNNSRTSQDHVCFLNPIFLALSTSHYNGTNYTIRSTCSIICIYRFKMFSMRAQRIVVFIFTSMKLTFHNNSRTSQQNFCIMKDISFALSTSHDSYKGIKHTTKFWPC